MNLIEEIDNLSPDPTVRKWVVDTFGKLMDQARRDALVIEALKLELAHIRRIRFGVKNESLTTGQLSLFEDNWGEDEAEIESAIEPLETSSDKQPVKRPRAGRQPLPDHLPREIHVHEPASCQCGQCGADMVKIGEDVSEQLDVIPSKFFVHRHIYPKYACRGCETVTTQPRVASIIEGGMAAPGLLTWVMISKYADHLPLYRLEQIAARSQVPLARTTLANWVGRTGFALQPLATRLAELLKERSVVHADETPVAQLDPEAGKTKRAYLWTWRSNNLDTGPPMVVFDYQGSRSGKHADSFLGNWRGHLMVDDYAGYKHLFTDGDVIELACWAHARRKFFDLFEANQSPIAATALKYMARLYALEGEGQDATVENRRERRLESREVLAEFHTWLTSTRVKVAPGSGTAKAMDYTLKRWSALIRYAKTGNLPIGRVEMWRGGGRSRHRRFCPFRLAVPYEPDRGSVSTSRSSNRTCGFPASGSLSDHQTFAFARSVPRGTRRISPSVS